MHNHFKKRMVESIKSKESIPREKQFDYIRELINTAQKEANKRFMLSISWYLSFQSYCEKDSKDLCSIDNSSLLNKETKRKEGLLYGKDYILLPETAWRCLVEWYGIKEKSHALIEINYHFTIYMLYEKAKQHKTITLHNQATVQSLYESLIVALKIATPISHVWLLDQAIESNLFVTEGLLNSIPKIEIDPLGFPYNSLLKEHLQENQETAYYLVIKFDVQRQSIVYGPRGLKNLGNTCYMNSAIQCLVSTELLTKWFLLNMYKEDINSSNPLGSRGELAYAYNELVRSLQHSNKTAVSPFVFKKTFEKFNTHFRGYEQQDSQEFLLFLLDGLHEDMNRISKKPYVESPDCENELQLNETAQLFWEYHKSRNDSIIVDLFHGQLKSKIICDRCNKVSITFDPFVHLSIPIPIAYCKLKIAFIHSSMKQTRFVLYLDRNSTVHDLHRAISEKLSVSEHFVITQMLKQMICKVFEDEYISEVSVSDPVYAYEVPSFVKTNSHCILFPVYHFLVGQDNHRRSKFGLPFLIAFDKSIQETDISKLVLLSIRKFAKKDFGDQKPSMFTLKLFNSKKSTQDIFPTLNALEDMEILQSQKIDQIQQGQGIIIEWPVDSAFNAFGYILKNSTEKMVNIDIWKNHTDLPAAHPFQNQLTLDHCIREFIKKESLSSDNLWYCHSCKSYQKAVKKLDLWRLPEIIIFHLKRFNQARVWGNKLSTYIDFPISGLDMSKYISGPTENSTAYDLYAIDNHHGGLSGGHYTTYALDLQDRDWYIFDDLSVAKLQHDEIKVNH